MPRTNLASDDVMTALSQFIQLRKEGWTREDAWYKTLETAGLSTNDEADLLYLAKKWEQREGNRHLEGHDSHNSAATITNRPAELEQTIAQHQGSIKRLTQPTTMLDANVLAQYEHLLKGKSAVITEPPIAKDDTHPLQQPTLNPQDEALRRPLAVVIYFRDFPETVKFEVPNGKELIIGRQTENSPLTPDVDLSKFHAGEFGVSRMHASLERRGNTLLLVDLGSRNFTFVNGEQLQPHEVRVLKSGDQVSFGRMLTAIYFQ